MHVRLAQHTASLSSRRRSLLARVPRGARSWRKFQTAWWFAPRASGWADARITEALGAPAEAVDGWMGASNLHSR